MAKHFFFNFSAVIVTSDKPWSASHADLSKKTSIPLSVTNVGDNKFLIDLSMVETSLNAIDSSIVYWNAPKDFIGNQVQLLHFYIGFLCLFLYDWIAEG